MECYVIVVGDPSEPRIQDCLADVASVGGIGKICPDVYAAAACLAGREPGVLVGTPRVLGAEDGQLLSLATQRGWRCVLLAESTSGAFACSWLPRLSEYIHLAPASDPRLWRQLLAPGPVETHAQGSTRSDDLPSPVEIEALLGGLYDD